MKMSLFYVSTHFMLCISIVESRKVYERFEKSYILQQIIYHTIGSKKRKYLSCLKNLCNWECGSHVQITSVRITSSILFYDDSLAQFQLEMGPDPTRAYIWPGSNKRPTQLRYFLAQPDEIFFYPKGKIEKFGIFRVNFPNPNTYQRCWPDPTPSNKNLTWRNAGQKILTWTHH